MSNPKTSHKTTRKWLKYFEEHDAWKQKMIKWLLKLDDGPTTQDDTGSNPGNPPPPPPPPPDDDKG